MNNKKAVEYLCHWSKQFAEARILSRPLGCLSCVEDDKMLISSQDFDFQHPNPEHIVCISLSDGSTIGFGEPHPEYLVHWSIYKAKKEVHAIVHSTQVHVMTCSKAGHEVFPMLDDLAQLVGASVKIVPFHSPYNQQTAHSVLKALKRRSGVLLEDNGGLCLGPNFDDAHAVCQVMEKGCKCQIETAFMGGGIKINWLEANLMRLVYSMSYSKAYKKNK